MNTTPEILIVDDQKFTHVLLTKALRELQLETVSAVSGQQALDLVEQHDFCVVLMDLRMPGMDGLETARKIRRNKRTADLPIIFITAATGDGDLAMQAYRLGAVDFLYKPVSAPVLKSKVNTFVELYRRRRELQQRNEQYRDILESVAEGLITVDMDWRIVEANDSACALFGYGHSELKGKYVTEIMSDAGPSLEQSINEQLENNISFQVETQGKHRNGSLFWADFRGTILMHRGAPHILAVTQDITAKKENERELQALRAQVSQSQPPAAQAACPNDGPPPNEDTTGFPTALSTIGKGIMDALDAPACMKDTFGNFICCNQRFATLFNTTSQALAGKGSMSLHPQEMAAFIQRQDMKILNDHQPQQFTLPAYMPDGNRCNFRHSRTLVFAPSGKPAAIICLLQETEP